VSCSTPEHLLRVVALVVCTRRRGARREGCSSRWQADGIAAVAFALLVALAGTASVLGDGGLHLISFSCQTEMRLGVHMTGAGVGASPGHAGKYMGRDMPCRLQPLRCLHVTAMQPSCRVPCAGDEAVLGNCTSQAHISGLLDTLGVGFSTTHVLTRCHKATGPAEAAPEGRQPAYAWLP
jgi:hypothetical protein